MKKIHTWFKRAGMLTAGVLVLAGCGNESGGNQQAENNELQEVDIMLDWYPNAVHSYLYTAQEKGYFEEEGLDVNIMFPANPTDPLNLAAAGEVDLGITYQPDVITARTEGIPVVSVAAIVRSPLNHVVYKADSDIERPKDLEGRTVGYPGIPVNEPIVETMVETDGGQFDEVDLVDIGFELQSSLISGRADAVSGAYINHEVPVLEHAGTSVEYFDPVDYGVPPFYELVLVTNEETLEEDEAKINAFWSAAEKGYTYMKDHPEESLDILFENEDQENFPLEREVEEESLDILMGKMETEEEAFGTQNRESWEETISWLKEMDYISETPDAEEIFVNTAE